MFRVNFLTFSAALGIVQVNLPSALACTKISEIRGQKNRGLKPFLKVQFLAKPKRINSLWSFGLTQSFGFALACTKIRAIRGQKTPRYPKVFSPPIRVFYPRKTRQPSTYFLNSLIHSR